jgi:hypothetical protein
MGPEGTPWVFVPLESKPSGADDTRYADAPFVFDIYLNPTTFPFQPPVVHFHSHTNGHGRCNRESLSLTLEAMDATRRPHATFADVFSQSIRGGQGVLVCPRNMGGGQERVVDVGCYVCRS